jgi:hypothetical protein
MSIFDFTIPNESSNKNDQVFKLNPNLTIHVANQCFYLTEFTLEPGVKKQLILQNGYN